MPKSDRLVNGSGLGYGSLLSRTKTRANRAGLLSVFLAWAAGLQLAKSLIFPCRPVRLFLYFPLLVRSLVTGLMQLHDCSSIVKTGRESPVLLRSTTKKEEEKGRGGVFALRAKCKLMLLVYCQRRNFDVLGLSALSQEN